MLLHTCICVISLKLQNNPCSLLGWFFCLFVFIFVSILFLFSSERPETQKRFPAQEQMPARCQSQTSVKGVRNSSSYSLIAELLSIWGLVVSLLHMMCGKLKGPKKVVGSIPDLLHLPAVENAQNRQTVFLQQPVGSFFSKTYIFTTVCCQALLVLKLRFLLCEKVNRAKKMAQ